MRDMSNCLELSIIWHMCWNCKTIKDYTYISCVEKNHSYGRRRAHLNKWHKKHSYMYIWAYIFVYNHRVRTLYTLDARSHVIIIIIYIASNCMWVLWYVRVRAPATYRADIKGAAGRRAAAKRLTLFFVYIFYIKFMSSVKTNMCVCVCVRNAFWYVFCANYIFAYYLFINEYGFAESSTSPPRRDTSCCLSRAKFRPRDYI